MPVFNETMTASPPHAVDCPMDPEFWNKATNALFGSGGRTAKYVK